MDKKKTPLEILASSKFVHTLLSIIIGFAVGALFLVIMGLSVGQAYGKLLQSIFSSIKSISYCIVYATPYIATGLSVAFSFKTGVFNIGTEGQFVVGSMSACVVGILLADLPPFVLIPLCFLAAALAGALWGTIVGILKTRWGINEVLSMIMFNWIAFFLSNYIAGFPAIHSEGNAEATRNISDNARILFSKDFISRLNLCPTANWGILVAIVLTVVVYIIIEKTTLGYELKAVGFNKNAAEYGGINVNRSILTSLAISGALAGIGGALLLLGMGGRISVFSSQEGYGFAGIVVALIGVTNPFGVFVAGLFYGAMTYGGSKLNLVGAPTQVVSIIMGTIVFFIAISSIFSYLKNLKKDKPVTPVKPVESGKEDDPE
ncbi:MAG: ABC transporter permease [Candidatus Faecousia sp.]|nr:ABC transporter permease [Candidatus Faecousia sp.]